MSVIDTHALLYLQLIHTTVSIILILQDMSIPLQSAVPWTKNSYFVIAELPCRECVQSGRQIIRPHSTQRTVSIHARQDCDAFSGPATTGRWVCEPARHRHTSGGSNRSGRLGYGPSCATWLEDTINHG